MKDQSINHLRHLGAVCRALVFLVTPWLISFSVHANTLFPEAELIDFHSVHASLGRADIVRRKPAFRQPLYGYFFKSNKEGKAATLVYIHSSSGLYRRLLGQWVEPLVGEGYNVLLVDSFTPRRIGSTTADQTQVFDFIMVIDALRALGAIGSRSEVDPYRVAIMGGSKGGIVAYETLYKEYIDAAQIGGLSFKIHIPLYPTCNWNDWTTKYGGGRVLAFLGSSDDFTPSNHCISHFEKMRESGATIDWRVYEGFHHGFDNAQGVRFISNAATSRNCGVFVDLADLQVKRRSNGSVILDPGAHYSSCNERGAHTGGTPEQLQRVRGDVLRFLREALD